MAKKLTLIVSKDMNSNKKTGREEHKLIRMAAVARHSLDLNDESNIEVTGSYSKRVLVIHQAFSKDIKHIRDSAKYSKEDLKHIGFVTTDMFKQLTGNNKTEIKDIWVSKIPDTTLIGADPEFLLFNDDGIVRANNIIQKNGKIGSDGAMMEIRPDPASDPESLVQNMMNIFKDKSLTDVIKDYKWRAAIYHKDDVRDYPVGGHIHLGNPAGITKLSTENKLFLFAVLNKIMDELLSLPLIKLDGADLGKARRSECQMAMGNTGYGYYGEWRSCDGRLEHRTLSGLWLAHPLMAELVLGTAKAIADEMFGIIAANNYNTNMFRHKDISVTNHSSLYSSEFDDWKNIKITEEMGCVRSSSYMGDVLNLSKATSINKQFLDKWYNKLKRMSTYNKYSEYIDGLRTILSMPKTTISNVGFDIKENWVNGKEFKIG